MSPARRGDLPRLRSPPRSAGASSSAAPLHVPNYPKGEVPPPRSSRPPPDLRRRSGRPGRSASGAPSTSWRFSLRLNGLELDVLETRVLPFTRCPHHPGANRLGGRRHEANGPVGRAVNRQLEDVESIVVAHDIVDLLRLDARSDIDLRVEQRFSIAHDVTHRLSSWA